MGSPTAAGQRRSLRTSRQFVIATIGLAAVIPGLTVHQEPFDPLGVAVTSGEVMVRRLDAAVHPKEHFT